MLKRLHLFFILILLTGSLAAQDRQIDSLVQVIKKGNDTGAVLALTQLADQYLGTGEAVKASEASAEAVEKGRRLNYQKGLMLGYYFGAKSAFYLSKYNDVLQLADTAIILSTALSKKNVLASALSLKGRAFMKLSNYSEAMEYMLKSKAQTEANGDKGAIISARLGFGSLYSRLGDHKKAMAEYRGCEDIAKAWNDARALGSVYVSISNVFSDMKLSTDSSTFYLLKALPIFQKLGDLNNISVVYSNLAYNYNDLKDYPNSIKYSLLSKALMASEAYIDRTLSRIREKS